MAGVPLWIEVLQALATPAIAFGGGVIAYRQWRTAERKLLLDLFERRLTAFNQVMDSFRPILRDGGVKDLSTFLGLATAIDNAHFLFGDDVRKCLRGLREDAALLSTAEQVIEDVNAPDRQRWIDAKYATLKTLLETFERLPLILEPYMGMPEKRPRTFVQIFRALNERRLSYADEKQK